MISARHWLKSWSARLTAVPPGTRDWQAQRGATGGGTACSRRESQREGPGARRGASLAISAACRDYLNRSLTRSVQLLALGEWRSPPFLRDSSSSLSSFFWCSVSLTGVSTV